MTSFNMAKVCGLCSELVDESVDESVEVSTALRIFLIAFLNVKNIELPTKFCLECYTHTVECKRFKDRCNATIVKLQRSNICSSKVLGKSPQDLKALKDMQLVVPPSAIGDENTAALVTQDAPPPAASKSTVVANSKGQQENQAGPASKTTVAANSKGQPQNQAGPASKTTVAAATRVAKRSNELKMILEAQAPTEVRKPKSVTAQDSRSNTKGLAEFVAAVLGPRGCRTSSTESHQILTQTTRGKSLVAENTTSALKPKTVSTRQQTQPQASSKNDKSKEERKIEAKSSRRSASTRARGHGFDPKVVIPWKEQQSAIQELERLEKIKAQSLKRPSQPQTEESLPPLKRGRNSLANSAPPTNGKEDNEKNSSVGRKINLRSDKGHGDGATNKGKKSKPRDKVLSACPVVSPEKVDPISKVRPRPASKMTTRPRKSVTTRNSSTPKTSITSSPTTRSSSSAERSPITKGSSSLRSSGTSKSSNAPIGATVINPEPPSKEKSKPKETPKAKPPKSLPKPASRKPPKNKSSTEEFVYVEANPDVDVDVNVDEDVEELSEDEDYDELFPSVGPYQCEICQKITDTKQEFVDHIKALHLRLIDKDVLETLEKDLEKSKKKMEKEQSRETSSQTSTSQKKEIDSLPLKSGVAASPEKPKVDNAKNSGGGQNVSVGGATCNICFAVLVKNTPHDISRHQNSKSCRIAAAALVVSDHNSDSNDEIDPLADVDHVNAQNFPSHYSSKDSVLKKYQNDHLISVTPVVIENAEEDVEMGEGSLVPVDPAEQIVPNDFERKNNQQFSEKVENLWNNFDNQQNVVTQLVYDNSQPENVDALNLSSTNHVYYLV